MAWTETIVDVFKLGRTSAGQLQPLPSCEIDSAAREAAHKQILALARALARIAAQEDDAAEHNEAGSAAGHEAAAATIHDGKEP